MENLAALLDFMGKFLVGGSPIYSSFKHVYGPFVL